MRAVLPAWQETCELVWAVGGATGLQLCLPRGPVRLFLVRLAITIT